MSFTEVLAGNDSHLRGTRYNMARKQLESLTHAASYGWKVPLYSKTFVCPR